VEHAQSRIQIGVRADQGKAGVGVKRLARMNIVAISGTRRGGNTACCSVRGQQTLKEAAMAAEINR
jgi:hypothetical protein